MGHYESFGGRGFLLLDSFTVLRGSNGIQVVLRSSLHSGTPENRHYDVFFFFQAEDGIRDVERSRGLGDVYKRQSDTCVKVCVFVRGCGRETFSS